MSHETSTIARWYDFVNREGLEWMMRPVRSYGLSRAYYNGKGHTAAFAMRFVTSLGILPILSTAYIFTRLTGVILNPYQWKVNPLKPFMMGLLPTAPFLILGLALGLKGLLNVVSLGFGGVLGGLMAFAVSSVIAAGMMYVGKFVNRSIVDTVDNRYQVVQAQGLSIKHRVSFDEHTRFLKPDYLKSLDKHRELKEKIPQNSTELQTQAKELESSKMYLAYYEQVVNNHHDRCLTTEDLLLFKPEFNSRHQAGSILYKNVESMSVKGGTLALRVPGPQ